MVLGGTGREVGGADFPASMRYNHSETSNCFSKNLIRVKYHSSWHVVEGCKRKGLIAV